MTPEQQALLNDVINFSNNKHHLVVIASLPSPTSCQKE
jgi:hypothetical protein